MWIADPLFCFVDDIGIEHGDQRTVWKTWKMNFETLSDTAKSVLTAFAFFDSAPVPIMQIKAEYDDALN